MALLPHVPPRLLRRRRQPAAAIRLARLRGLRAPAGASLTGSRALVLCYHAASDVWDHALAVPPARLVQQVRVARRLRRDVVVTFDDAFTSIERVAPALERLGVKVIVFACPEFADTRRPLDIPELADDAKAQPEELRTMGWDELRALARRDNFHVESHTLSHPHLTRLDDAELERELRESRERIAAELGACRYLAYPFGEEDARVNEAARDAGYDAAFGLPGDARRANPFSLPRVGVYRKDNSPRFMAKTFAPLQRAAAAVRR